MSDYAYIVSVGSYSSYRVLCACPTEVEAEALAAKINERANEPDLAGVEELPVVTSDDELGFILHLRTLIWAKGKEDLASEHIEVVYPRGPLPDVVVQTSSDDDSPCSTIFAHGVDHERVRKEFNDAHTQLLAKANHTNREQA